MKRLLLAGAISVISLLVSATTGLASSTASAEQHPVGGSGIHGDITFVDNPVAHTLTVHGTATGLKPGVGYFSLIYSNGTQPGGVSESKSVPATSNATPACTGLPKSGATPTVDGVQMVVGQWHNNNDGTGTIDAVKTVSGNSQESSWFSIPVTIFNPQAGKVVTLPLGVVVTFFGYTFGSNSYAPIGSFPTVSIRSEEDPFNPFALVACGQVQAP